MTLYELLKKVSSILAKGNAESSSVWQNEVGNLCMMDCGCGLSGGRLACICLETGERFYS